LTTEVAPSPVPPGLRRGAKVDLILLGVGALIFVAICLLAIPIIVLLLSSFTKGLLLSDGALSLANFDQVLEHRLFYPTLRNTLVTGVGTVAVMLLFAVPCAWLYTRTDLPRKDLLVALLTVKIAIPSFLIAMGYVFLFNPSNGIGNQIARDVFGIAAPFNVYTLGWIIWLQGAALASPAFFMIVPTFRAIDAALEEAAWVSGVRKSTTAARIVVPLAAPAVLATSMYYFIIAIEMFDYAGILGLPSRTFVMSTWIYHLVYFSDSVPQYGPAAALGVLTAIAAALMTVGYIWATRQAGRYAVVTGKRRVQSHTRLGRTGKVLAWCFIAGFASFSLLIPLLLLIWSSLFPFVQMPSADTLHLMSLDGYREALLLFPPLLKNSLVVMIAVPTISVALAACLAWITTRTSLPGRQMLDILVMVAIAVPSIVGALGFLYFGLITFQLIPIYTTIWILVLAMAARSLTWANRTVGSAMMQVHKEIEEVCATSGVKRGRAFLSVLLPTVGPALLFSWFWLAMLSLRELTIPVMLARENTQVIATAIWALNQSGASDTASALGIMLVGLISVVVLLFHRFAGQREF
jgi:iron(III) transport system permease protein